MCRLLPHSTRPSPNSGRVGIRIVLFEACSGFTRVTARTLAQPPKAAFVTGLRRNQLPGHAARQLPAQSTTRWVEPSSTGVSRLRGAPELADMQALPGQPSQFANSEDSIASGSGHRHPARWVMLKHEWISPLPGSRRNCCDCAVWDCRQLGGACMARYRKTGTGSSRLLKNACLQNGIFCYLG